jgi:hypothetical protein
MGQKMMVVLILMGFLVAACGAEPTPTASPPAGRRVSAFGPIISGGTLDVELLFLSVVDSTS